MDLYLLKLTIRKKKPLRSFYVMTANMDLWFWEVLYEYIIGYGSGQPPENRVRPGSKWEPAIRCLAIFLGTIFYWQN